MENGQSRLDEIKTYLFLEDDIDELGWSDEKIEEICKDIVNTMLQLEIMEEDDLQEFGGFIDYSATACDTVEYLSDKEKNRILSTWKTAHESSI